MGNIAQLQVRKVTDRLGREGQVVSPPSLNDERAYAHTADRALQIWNVLVDATPTITTVYSITAVGETVTFTSTGTRADDVDGLVAAVNANPILRGIFTASNSADTTVVLTANAYGVDVAVTVDDEDTAELTLSEATEPADATQILPGRAVYRDGSGGVTMTNPVSGSLSRLAGFARFLYASEQTSVGSNDNDLYEANETVAVSKTARMIQKYGSTAVEGDEIWIEQSAGTNLGRCYTTSGATSSTLTITPTAGAGETYTIDLLVNGVPVAATYTGGGAETVQNIVEGLDADLDGTSASILTSAEDDATLTVTFTDPDATIVYSLSSNLAGVEANDGTRLKLDASLGQWADAHEIEFKLGL